MTCERWREGGKEGKEEVTCYGRQVARERREQVQTLAVTLLWVSEPLLSLPPLLVLPSTFVLPLSRSDFSI